jgi:hypothetical protein
MSESYIGEDELESVMAGMGISGLSEIGADEIGAAVKAVAGKLAKRKIVPMSSEGRPRGFPFLMANLQGLADAGSSTISGTADRRSLLRYLFVEANSAAGALLRGVTVTSCTVSGRNSVVGTGGIPAHTAFGEYQPPPSWNFGVIESGNTAVIGILNNAGAAVDVYSGFLAESVD